MCIQTRLTPALAVSLLIGAVVGQQPTSAWAQCVQPPSGAVSWWPGDGTDDDIVGTNGGTSLGGATFAPGKVGEAFSFDGIDDYVQVSDPDVPLGASPRTIEFWFQTDQNLLADTESALIQYGSNSVGQMFGLITSLNAPGRLYFFGYAFDMPGTTTLQIGQWYHTAVTYDGTTVRLYVNGNLDASSALALNTVLDVNGLTIGLRPSVANWDGLIDEVVIYDRALDASEIGAIFNAGNDGKCKSVSVCGDGLVEGGEDCDDGNVLDGDGCSAVCLVENGFECAGQPSVCTPIPCTVPPSGLVSWWDGDAVSGTAALDIQDGNDGTLVNGATTAPGFVGQAFGLGGAGDHVLVPSSGALQFVNDFAVSLWAKPDLLLGQIQTMASRYDASCWNGGNDCLAYILRLDGDGVVRAFFASDSGNAQVCVAGAVDTNWHHYVLNYENSVGYVYVDGAVACTVSTGFDISSRVIPTAIGSNSVGSENFGGLIDEVQVFNTPLSGVQILDIVDAGSVGVCKPVCGDGLVEGGEDCDDGNVLDGDGCSAVCLVESVFECAGQPSVCTAIPCAVPPSGLVSWWDGDAVAADTVSDIQDANDGTLINGARTVAGIVGQAFGLDGANDHVLVPSSGALQFVNDFAVSLWAKPDLLLGQIQTMASRYDASCWNGGNDCLAYILRLDGDGVVRAFFASDSGNAQVCVAGAVDTNWHHYILNYENSVGYVYVDGAVACTVSTGFDISSRVIPTAIGSNSVGSENFGGLIDEVQVFNTPLSGVQILDIVGAGGAGVCKPAPQCVQPPSGAVSWWPGDGTDDDIVGTNGGTSLGGATFAPGKVGEAFSFDGIDDYVQVSDPDVPLGASPRTIEFWFQTDQNLLADTESALIQYGSNSVGQMFGLITSLNAPGRLYFFGYAFDMPGTTTLQIGQWYHTAVTYDGTTVRLYVNGNLDASSALALNTVLDVNGLTIGLRPSVANWDGLIDEVAIYDRALDASEIGAIFNAGNDGKCKGGEGPVCDVGGPYTADCAGPLMTVPLDGSASSGTGSLTFGWTSDCPGASFDDATSATPILEIDSSAACGVGSCEVTLTVNDDSGSDTRTAPVTINPDTTLADVAPLRVTTHEFLGTTGTRQALIEFENTGSCPAHVTALSIDGDFSNPALSLAPSAPATPFTMCAGQTVAIPIDITTALSVANTYPALVRLSGAGGSVTAGLELRVTDAIKPDIALGTPTILGDVEGPPPLLDETQGFTISTTVSNIGNSDAGAFAVEFRAVVGTEVAGEESGERSLGVMQVPGPVALPQGGTTVLQLHVAGLTLPIGFHVIRVQLVELPPEGDLLETNNSAAAFMQLGTLPVEGAVVVVSAGATQGCVGDIINISGRADYFLLSTTAILLDFPVQGGRVTVTVIESAAPHTEVSVTSTVHTLTTGTFLQPVPTPPPGDYVIRVEVTDFSVDGVFETAPITILSEAACTPPAPPPPPPVPPPPVDIDLWTCSDLLEFFVPDGSGNCGVPLSGNAATGQPVCIRTEVVYDASVSPAPELTQQLAALAHVHNPATGQFDTILIGSRPVTFINAGSLQIEFTWDDPPAGEHVIEVAWEPTISQYTANDRATRGLIVGSGGPLTPIDVVVDASGCNGQIYITGRADYVSDSGDSVAVGCGLVTASISDASGPVSSSGGVTRTASDGSYTTVLFASTPPGSYTVLVDVSDGTLMGTGSDSLTCVAPDEPDPIAPPPPPPSLPVFFGDVYIFAEDIVFLSDPACSVGLLRNPEAGEQISIHATVHYAQSGPPESHTVTFTAVEHLPIGEQLVPVTIGSSAPLSLPPVGGTVDVCIPWTPTTNGTRIVQILLTPDFMQYELNDAATRLLTVGYTVCTLELSDRTVAFVAGESDAIVVAGDHTGSITPTFDLEIRPLPPAETLPAGLTVAFDPTATGLTSPFETLLTVTTDVSLPPGRYPLFVLGLGDFCNALGTFTLNVASPNLPPVCDGGGPYQSECSGPAATTTVQLDGTASSDPDIDPLTYFWTVVEESGQVSIEFDETQGSGTSMPELIVDTSNVCNAPVAFDVELAVIDTFGAFDECTATVSIEGDSLPPVLTVDTTPIELVDDDCSTDETLMLPVATATDDCDQDPALSNDAPSVFPAGHTTTVTYTASDDCENQDTATVDVTVLHGANILIVANKHTVGSGSHPDSTKEPLVGIEVCAFDKSDGSCAHVTCGGISHQHYQCIVDSCGTDDGELIFCCTTGTNGECTINAPPGDYVVISDDATKTVLPDPLGVSASDLICGELKRKHLQQIVRANGSKKPGKTTRLTGSELLIIEPEYVLWDETEQFYPFVFESIGDWGVTTSVVPPEGFVADYPELSEYVDNALEAVQFIITEVGSDLLPTETTFEVTHNGQHHTVRSQVDIRLTPDYATSRGFDVAKLRAKGLIMERPTNKRSQRNAHGH